MSTQTLIELKATSFDPACATRVSRGSKATGLPELRRFSRPAVIAAQLGICTRTLRRWADRGLITRHKINARVVFFDETEVSAVITAASIVPIHQINRDGSNRGVPHRRCY